MGATITRSKAPTKPKVTRESSHSQATGADTNSSAQADKSSDLNNIVTNTEESPKKEVAAEPNQSQNTKAITSPNQADRPGDDLKEKGSLSQTTQDDTKAENMSDQDDESDRQSIRSKDSSKGSNLSSLSTSEVTDCTKSLQSDHSSISSGSIRNDISEKQETLREKMASYKALYDAGQTLPDDTDDDFYPDYVLENSEYKSQIVDWMVEYSVPELYLKTLETTTYTTWLGEESTRVTPLTGLNNLYFLIDDSTILAERLLASGFLDYAVKNLKDQRYLENYKDNLVVRNVMICIADILKNCIELVPDHATYNQAELTQVLKKYISSDVKYSALAILLKIANEDECTALVNTELEDIRAKMESYKQLYDAGDSLPGRSDYNLCPGYLWHNTVYQAKAVSWMLEYKVPELFKRTLDGMTPTTIRSDGSVYTTCRTMLHILFNMTDFSKIIAERLLDLGYIDYYVAILTDPQYTENQHEAKAKKMLKYAIGTVGNCIRFIPGNFIYKELQLKEVMKPYLASDMQFRASAMIIYSSVIEERDSKQLDDAGCIPYMIMGIKDAINGSGRRFRYGSGSFNIYELLECVSRMAANDDNKTKLVDAGLLPLLVRSLQTGDEQEQEISAKLTWTLCFDDNISEQVVNQPGLVTELERLSTSSSRGVQKAVKGALWKISGEENHQQQAQQQTYDNKHIFISYQWDDQQVIVQLNQRLKGEYTYKREKPLIPLMMQRRYKPDGWLGMLMGVKLYINFDGKYEFEKAYQMLMKEIRPILKVDPHIDSTDGAAIVPQVSSVSHTASPASHLVSQPTSQLLSQLVSQLASQPAAFIDPVVATWSHQQVLEWATKHNLIQRSPKFDSVLKSLDGKHLVKFCQMEMRAPEFFYKMMRKQCKLDIVEIISLELAMEDLHQ